MKNLHTCFYKGCTICTPTKAEKQFHFPISTLVFVVSFKVSYWLRFLAVKHNTYTDDWFDKLYLLVQRWQWYDGRNNFLLRLKATRENSYLPLLTESKSPNWLGHWPWRRTQYLLLWSNVMIICFLQSFFLYIQRLVYLSSLIRNLVVMKSCGNLVRDSQLDKMKIIRNNELFRCKRSIYITLSPPSVMMITEEGWGDYEKQRWWESVANQ